MSADILEHKGRRCRIEPRDCVRHSPGKSGEGAAWDFVSTHPFLSAEVYVYLCEDEPEQGAAVTAGEQDELPEFLRPEPTASAPGPLAMPSNEPPPREDEKGLKFRYGKALRGRVGHGPGQLTPAEFVLLSMLLTYADENLRHAHPGNARLAADCGMTGKGAAGDAGKRAGAVASKGFSVVTRRGTNVGGNVSQEYRLKLPEWP